MQNGIVNPREVNNMFQGFSFDDLIRFRLLNKEIRRD